MDMLRSVIERWVYISLKMHYYLRDALCKLQNLLKVFLCKTNAFEDGMGEILFEKVPISGSEKWNECEMCSVRKVAVSYAETLQTF